MNLKEGRYLLIPSVTDVRFSRRARPPPGESKLVKKDSKLGEKPVLTAGFKYFLCGILIINTLIFKFQINNENFSVVSHFTQLYLNLKYMYVFEVVGI